MISWYRVQNKNRFSEKYAHHLFFKFYPLRTENEPLAENLTSFVETHADPIVMQIRNRDKTKIEPFGDMV